MARGTTTLLIGDSGIGKTLLEQELQYTCATGTPWLGQQCVSGPTTALYCEDDPDHLHRRFDRIRRQFGQDIPPDALFYTSGVGRDAVMTLPDRHNGGRPSGLHHPPPGRPMIWSERRR
jgi:hypothetical protein